MEEKIGKSIIIGVVVILGFLVLCGLIISANESSSSLSTGGSSSSSYSSGGSSSSSYSGGSSSSGSSYKSNNPADYDSKGNYKPVESMTQKEKKDELTQILKDSLQ